MIVMLFAVATMATASPDAVASATPAAATENRSEVTLRFTVARPPSGKNSPNREPLDCTTIIVRFDGKLVETNAVAAAVPGTCAVTSAAAPPSSAAVITATSDDTNLLVSDYTTVVPGRRARSMRRGH